MRKDIYGSAVGSPYGAFDKFRNSSGSRVVFLGIDGVPYGLVDEHPDVFPNLTEIAETGSGGQIFEHRAARVERLLAGINNGDEPRKDRRVRVSGP